MAFNDEQDEAAEIAVFDVVRLPENVASLAPENAPENVVQKCGGSGSGSKRGGSGLPNVAQVQWERCTDRPGLKAWHAPEGNAAPRNTKTYLGYVGKALLAEWEAMPAVERRAAVVEWINEKRNAKGTTKET